MDIAEPRSFLLDTHAFLWLAAGDDRVPESVRESLSPVEHRLRLSAASVWEMAIKSSLGKLRLGAPLPQFVNSQCAAIGVERLAVTVDHALVVERLEWHHRDPFDRLLVAQAIVEDLELVSRDRALDSYPIRRIW